MKKRIFSLLLAAVMVVAMIPATFMTVFAEGNSGNATNDDGYHVAYTYNAITADGVIDSAYLEGTKILIENVVAGADTGTKGYAYMAYDEDYLYIAVSVSDSTNDGANDYVALTLDWLYDAELFATGAANYMKADYYTAPALYLGYSAAGRSDYKANELMFAEAITPDVKYAVVGSTTNYVVEYKIAWTGNIKNSVSYGGDFDIGAGIVICDNGVEVSNSTQANAANKAFSGAMLPKATVSKTKVEGTVAYTDASLEADGVIDDVYKTGKKIEINNVVAGDDKGTSGYAYMAYDQNYLYIAVYVNDESDDGTSDYVALTLDWLYDAQLFATGAGNYKNETVGWKDDNLYLGYNQAGRVPSNASNTWNAWMFSANTGKVPSTTAYAAVENSTDYVVEYKIEWKGNVKKELCEADFLAFGAGIIIYDNGSEVSNSNQDNATNKAFTGAMLPKFVISPNTEAVFSDIAYSKENLVIDGEIDDKYLDSKPIKINSYVGGNGENDLGKSIAYTAFTNDALYLIIDVVDSTIFANGYFGDALDGGGEGGLGGNVHEGAEILVDFFRATATEQQMALTGADYKTAAGSSWGYFRSSYQHNIETDSYGVRSWYNSYLFGAYTSISNAAVKILEDGSGYRLEYRFAFDTATQELVSGMEYGEYCEIGLGLILRDDATDDGRCYRDSVYKSCNVATADPKAVTSFMLSKPYEEKVSNDVEISYSKTAPTLDGEIDDMYLNSTPIKINKYHGTNVGEGGEPVVNNLGESVAYAVFTNNTLYLIIDVKDSTIFGDGYNGNAEYPNNGPVHEGTEVIVDFYRTGHQDDHLNLDDAAYKAAALEGKEIAYFKSSYNHNAETDTYTAYSWGNSWMWASYADSPLSSSKLKVLEDGTGYRLEYRFPFTGSVSTAVRSMKAGESCEIGLGILLRDNVDGAAEGYRYNVYKSCEVNTAAPGQVASLKLVKPYESEIVGAGVSLGEDISVNYYANIPNEAIAEAPKMSFNSNGTNTEVLGTYNRTNNIWQFTYEGIDPQAIGDNVWAKLLVNDKVVATKDKYSVLENVTDENVMNDDNKQLIYDLLAYGAAAQQYAEYKTDALVNAGYESLATKVTAITNGDRTIGAALSDAQFTAAGVYHASVNKLYVKLEADDIANVTVTINGEKATIEEFGDDEYIVYSEGIKATDFDEVYTFVLTSAAGTQTLTYSVNAYAKAMLGSDNSATVALVKALYAYGCSAEEYAG